MDANSLSSLIPDTAESITEAMLDEKFAKRVNADPVLQDVIKYSRALEGTVKSYGVHACVAHNTKIRTDTGIKTISEVYNMTNGEGENLPPTLPVCTTYGLMHSRIVKTGKKKGYSVSLFSGDDNREISNAIVSADHKIWAGREGYLKYSSMKAGTKYYYTAKTYSPWFVTDLFIAGFLLVMISKNVFENNYTMTRDSFGFKLEDMWEIFRDLYVDGYASFDRAWGKTHRVSSLTQLAKRIYGLTKLENISYSIVKSYGVDELFYKNLFEQQDFIHGMFSSLQAYREVSISTPTTISISNINDLSSQDFTISNQSGYSSPQIVNIGGIKEYLNDHLRQFDIQLGNILFLDDVNFCRYITYNPIFSGGVRPPDVYVMKMGLYSSTSLDMYDVQVITFDDSRQNFIANGIHVHNCGVILSPVPLNETVPLYAQDGLPVTMYDGPTMEKLNFI